MLYRRRGVKNNGENSRKDKVGVFNRGKKLFFILILLKGGGRRERKRQNYYQVLSTCTNHYYYYYYYSRSSSSLITRILLAFLVNQSANSGDLAKDSKAAFVDSVPSSSASSALKNLPRELLARPTGGVRFLFFSSE